MFRMLNCNASSNWHLKSKRGQITNSSFTIVFTQWQSRNQQFRWDMFIYAFFSNN